MPDSFARLLTLSKEILNAAQDQNWDQVQELQEQRDSLMQDCSQEAPNIHPKDGTRLQNLIREVKRLDGETYKIANKFRKEYLSKSQKQTQTKKAIKAYRDL